jgi:plasmid replication initiation protein
MQDNGSNKSQTFETNIGLIDQAPISFNASIPPAANTSLRISRDEMNLAEFPLTVLSKRSDPSIKTLEFSDYVKGKNGDLINRKWIITGADKFGLPTSSDDEVLLGLLKLTADDGLRSRKIHFTRYELLRILRWTTEGRSYTRLQNALDRLSGVRIKASNAFYDNESKLHSTRNFGIIDAYEINDGRDTRPSFFTWSEVLFKSFQVGFIKKLDLDFYLDLESAVSKRLYRYLDKHFWYRSKIQVNLFTLAHEKIGVSRNYVYASSLRQQIEPALEELKERGILSEYYFTGKGKSTEVILIAAHAPKKVVAATSNEAESAKADHLRKDLSSGGLADKVMRALVERGLAEKQARKLTEGQGAPTLERMLLIVARFDELISSQSSLVSRSPTGFLYRAVERPFEFVLPGEKRERQGELNLESGKAGRGFKDSATPGREAGPRIRGNTDRDEALVSSTRLQLEVQYLTERKEKLDQVLQQSSVKEREKIRQEVDQGLSKLRSYISPQRFNEAVQHGVEQRLLDAYGFPEFDVWAQKRR